MLHTMRYRLALDIGTTSIGWCLLRLNTDNQPYAIIKMGVRIFPEGREAKSGESLAVTRRLARQQRRRRDRLLKRKAAMQNALVNLGFWPNDDTERQALVTLDPYVLRAKGLDQPLTPAEFGRAVFHLNQRRGFKSNRKTDKADNDSGALKTAIKQLKAQLADQQCRTLGEFLALRHTNRQGTRARMRNVGKKDQSYDFYIDRSMIEAEFDFLWRAQAMHQPNVYSTVAYEQLKDILLYQRPLKPVKAGRCTLLPDEERAPLALPSTQRFRTLQELNNLRFVNPDLTARPLSLEQRNAIFDLLERHHSVTFSKILKTLKLPSDTVFNLEDAKRSLLKGNATSAQLSKPEAFGEHWHSYSLQQQDDIVLQLLTQENESALIEWLMQHTGIDENTAARICNMRLPEGYGSLSKQAIDRILPPLTQAVMVYSDAVIQAGFTSHSALNQAANTGEILEALPYYGAVLQRHVGFGSNAVQDPDDKRYGRIANPTVHIGLNQVRRVVNAIIAQYGHPSEVILEVTRDLKISKQRRQEIEKEQALNQKRNENNLLEACQHLGITAALLDKSKRRNLAQKMQLWKELNWADPLNRCCPYTGEKISIDLLLSQHVEVEHILPYSKTFDDTLHNKTVALTKANRDKGNRTPFEAFGNNPPGYNYDSILERAATMPANKRKRFAKDGYEQWLGKEGGNFMARALNDTAYLSRIVREYLQYICPGSNSVRAIPGRMTGLIRGKFGLNELLSGNELKNRNDHRHHALDAAVIGITDQGLLQKFSRASASARDQGMEKLLDTLDLPWPSYRQHIERALANIFVSYKPDHSYEGKMHEDTAWGLLDDGKVQRRITPEGANTRQKLIKKLGVIPINSTSNRTRHGVDQNGVPFAYKGYLGGNNDCIEITRNDKGMWEGQVISTFEAYQIARKVGVSKAYAQLRHPTLSQSGKPLVMRLINNDCVRMVVNGYVTTLRVAVISNNGQIFFAPHQEANVDARNRDKADAFAYISKTAGSLQKAKGRKITVDALGNVTDPKYKP